MITKPPNNRSEQVLRWTHALLAGNSVPLDDLMASLATAFDVKHVSLAATIGRRTLLIACTELASQELPWDVYDSILDEIQSSPSALPLRHDDWALLARGIADPKGGDWLIWATDDKDRTWSAAEKAAFALAAHALVQSFTANDSAGSRMIVNAARVRRQMTDAARVAARLSHDFSNMLTSILGFAELCMSQIPRDTLPARFVREVWQSSSDAAQWIRRLQLFCRETKGDLPPAHLAAIIEQQQRRMHTAWGDHIATVANIPSNLSAVAMDAESLRHVLEQLLQNAGEAITGEAITGEGVITITARELALSADDCLKLVGAPRPGNHLEITIEDSGHGMSDDVQHRALQEMFFSSKGRHRGLGLAIVYGMLRNHCGGLRFSQATPQGTIVRVYLPVADMPRPAATASRQRNERTLVAAGDLHGKN